MMGNEAVDALAHSIAGAGGGCVALAITYPLLTATTRLQIQQVRSLTRDGKPYKNALDAIQRITTEEGWRKLYAGLKAALSGNIVSMGVYYYFYALLMGIAQGRDEKGRPLRHLTTGMSLLVAAGAGAINALATHPMWTITTRMQANTRKYALRDAPVWRGRAVNLLAPSMRRGMRSDDKRTSLSQTLRDLIAQDGIFGLWKGIVPALVLVSNPTVQYMVYEQLSVWWIARTTKSVPGKRIKHRRLSTSEVFVLGAIGKIVATIVTYPLIVVKSRIQTEVESNEAHGSGWLQGIHSTIAALRSILKQEGWWGFYSGLKSKILQSVLTAAIMFVLKDKFVGYVRWFLFAIISSKRLGD